MHASSVSGTWRSALATLLLVASLLPAGAGGVAAAARVSEDPGAQVLDVATGIIHTCAIRADGTVGCWGDNESGQATPPDGTFIAIDAENDTTCGIRPSGSLACWGAGFETGDMVPGGTFKDVSLGPYHACAIRTDDTVDCWGDNEEGQSTPPDGIFTAISAGGFFTCGLRSNGRLECWGGLEEEELTPVPTDDVLTQLDGTCAIRADETLTCWTYPGEWVSPLAGTFVAIGGSCAIRTDQTIACFGADDDTGITTPPTGTFQAISENNSHACAIRTDQTLACWGGDWMGQAQPRATPSVTAEPWRTSLTASVSWSARYALSPVASYDVRYRRALLGGKFGAWAMLLTNTTETSGSFSTAMGYTYCYSVRARDVDGVVSRWTNQDFDSRFNGCSTTPVDDDAFTRSTGWTAGTGAAYYQGTRLRSTKAGSTLTIKVHAHWVALVATTCPDCGSVRVSFDREMSQTISLTSPTRMHQRFIPVWDYFDSEGSTGGTVTVRVLTDGKPVIIDGILATQSDVGPAWADGEDPPVPGIGGSTRSATTISAGESHTCAIKPDASLACWGSNIDMQSSAPANGFTSVSAGVEATCGVRSDATLTCWGGDSPWSYDDPIKVPAGNFASVSSGWFTFCAIRQDGSITCWGDLGGDFSLDGAFTGLSVGGPRLCAIRSDATMACWWTFGEKGEPAMAPEGTFAAVSAGNDHVCAIRTDGTLTCWGSNIVGEATPPDGTFTAVSAGDLFTCGIRTDATLACWGDDAYLQASPPAGTFATLDAGRRHACAIRTGGGLACWGQNRSGQVTPRPTARVGALPAVTVETHSPAQWSANGLASIASYDVRYRRQRLGGRWGAWTAWRTGTTAVSGSLPIADGRNTCAATRARDVDGQLSAWSSQRCTTAPFDDRSLGRSGGWHVVTSPAYYRETALRSKRQDARLTLGKVPVWSSISLVATTCPTCGSVRVSWGWGAKTVSLYSASTQQRQVIRVRRFDDDLNPGRSAVTITVVSSNKKVLVDGLLIAGPKPYQQ